MKNSLLTVLIGSALLAACGGGGSSTPKSTGTTTLASGTPGVVEDISALPPEPVIAAPLEGESLYKIYVIDRASQKPIANARVMLLRNQPEALYMRSPARKDVVFESKTRIHGMFFSKDTADGAMKYALVTGTGFIPTLVEAGASGNKQTHIVKVEVDIVPVCKFTIYSPNGELADNALCTMKPDEAADTGIKSTRPGQKANYGWTERADDSGTATFNREPGTYLLEFSDRDGKFRWYERFQWTGQQTAPREVRLPAESQNKPW